MYIQGGPKKLGSVNISTVMQFYGFLTAREKSRVVLKSLCNVDFVNGQFNLFWLNFKCIIIRNSTQK